MCHTISFRRSEPKPGKPVNTCQCSDAAGLFGACKTSALRWSRTRLEAPVGASAIGDSVLCEGRAGYPSIGSKDIRSSGGRHTSLSVEK